MKLIYMAENIPLPRFKPKEKKEGILLPRSKPKEKKVAGTDKLYSMMGKPSSEDVIIRGRGEAGLTEEARRVYESSRKSGQHHTKPLPEEEGGFFDPLVSFFTGDSEEDVRPVTEEELYGASLEEQKLGLPFAPRKTTEISRKVRKALIKDAGKFPLVALGLDPRRLVTVPEYHYQGQHIPHKDDPKSSSEDHLNKGERNLLKETGDRPYLSTENDFLVAKQDSLIRRTIYHEGMHKGISDLLASTDYKLPLVELASKDSIKIITKSDTDTVPFSKHSTEEILVRLMIYRDLIPLIEPLQQSIDSKNLYQSYFENKYSKYSINGKRVRLDIDKILEDPKINAELDKLNSMAQKLREEKGHSSGKTFKNFQSGGLNIANGLGSAPPYDPFHPPRNGLVSPKQESGYYYDPDTDEEGYIPTKTEKEEIASDPRSLMTREDIEDIEAREDILAPHKPTWREEGRATIQDFLTSVGMDKHAARNFAESTLGNPASERKLGLGLADVTGLDIAYMAQEGVQQAQRGVATGDIGEAAMGSGIAALSTLPFGVVLSRALKSKAGQNYIKKTAEDFTKRWKEGKSPVPIGLTTEDVSTPLKTGKTAEDSLVAEITATKKPRPDIDELGFYSVAGRAIDELPLFKHQQVAPGDQVLKAIIKRGVTKEEIHATGLAKFLEGKKKVTQQEVQDYFKANQVKLSEVVLKDQDDLPQLEWGDKSFISSERYKDKKTKTILDALLSYASSSLQRHTFKQEFNNIYRHMSWASKDAGENKYPTYSDQNMIDTDDTTYNEIRRTVNLKGIEGLDPEIKKDFLNALDTSIQEDIDVVIEEGGNFELIKTKDGKYEIFGHNLLDWNTSVGADEGLVDTYSTLEEAKIQTQAHEDNITRPQGSEVIGARWREYASPGGENYEEILLTVPRQHLSSDRIAREMSTASATIHGGPINYTDPHYRDIKDNIVAHLRTTKRDNVNVEGEIIETLHAEEIQSKVHSQGREQGYVQEPPPITEEIQAKLDRYKELKYSWTEEQDDLVFEAIKDEYNLLKKELNPWLEDQSYRIADLPFKEVWHEMLFNRLVYKAIKEGKNSVSWTVGSTQADRYGDERLIPFYDTKLTGYAQKFSNKHGGAKVTKGSFERTLTEDDFLNLSSATPDNILSRIYEKQREEVWVLPITKEMRESVLKEGNKQFKTGGLITKQKNFQSGGLNMARTEEEVYDDTEDQMDMMGFEPQEQSIDPVSGNEVPLGGTAEGVRDDIDVKMSKGEMVIPEYAVNYHGVETYINSIQKAQRGYEQMQDMGLVGNPDEAVIDQGEPLPKMEENDTLKFQAGGAAPNWVTNQAYKLPGSRMHYVYQQALAAQQDPSSAHYKQPATKFGIQGQHGGSVAPAPAPVSPSAAPQTPYVSPSTRRFRPRLPEQERTVRTAPLQSFSNLAPSSFGGLASAPLPTIPTPTIAQPVTEDISTLDEPLRPVSTQPNPTLSPYPSGYFIEIEGQPNMFKFVAPPGQQNTLTGTYTREQVGNAPIAPAGTTPESVYGPQFQTYTPSYTLQNIPSTGGYEVIPYTNAEGDTIYMTSVNGQIQGTVPQGYSPSVEEDGLAPQMEQPVQAPVVSEKPFVPPGGYQSGPPGGGVGVTPPSVTPTTVSPALSAENQATVQSIQNAMKSQGILGGDVVSEADIVSQTAPHAAINVPLADTPLGNISTLDVVSAVVKVATKLAGLPSVVGQAAIGIPMALAFHKNQTATAQMQAQLGIEGAAFDPVTGWSFHKTESMLGLHGLVAYNKFDVTSLRNPADVMRTDLAMRFNTDFTGMTNTEIFKSQIKDKNGVLIGFDAPKGQMNKSRTGMHLSDGTFYSHRFKTISDASSLGDFQRLSPEIQAKNYAIRNSKWYRTNPIMTDAAKTIHNNNIQLTKQLYPTIAENSSEFKNRVASVAKNPSASKQISFSKAAVKGQANLSGSGGRKSGLSAGFSGKTGGFCWVARKVYGEDNPKWQIFRSWLCTQAPKWLYKAYGKYGESFAEWLDGKERTQKIIRKWMDKRIQKYLDTQPKTAQEIGPL